MTLLRLISLNKANASLLSASASKIRPKTILVARFNSSTSAQSFTKENGKLLDESEVLRKLQASLKPLKTKNANQNQIRNNLERSAAQPRIHSDAGFRRTVQSPLTLNTLTQPVGQPVEPAVRPPQLKETWPSRRDPVSGKLVRYRRSEYIAELIAAGKTDAQIPPEFRFVDDDHLEQLRLRKQQQDQPAAAAPLATVKPKKPSGKAPFDILIATTADSSAAQSLSTNASMSPPSPDGSSPLQEQLTSGAVSAVNLHGITTTTAPTATATDAEKEEQQAMTKSKRERLRRMASKNRKLEAEASAAAVMASPTPIVPTDSATPLEDLLRTLVAEEEEFGAQFIGSGGLGGFSGGNPLYSNTVKAPTLQSVVSTKTAADESIPGGSSNESNNNSNIDNALMTTTSSDVVLSIEDRYRLAHDRLQLKNMTYSHPRGKFVEEATGFEATAAELNAEHFLAFQAKQERDLELGVITDRDLTKPVDRRAMLEQFKEYRRQKHLARPRGKDGRLITHYQYRQEQLALRQESKPDFKDRFPDTYRRGLFRHQLTQNYDSFASTLRRLVSHHFGVKQVGETLGPWLTADLINGLSDSSTVKTVYALGRLALNRDDEHPEVVTLLLQRTLRINSQLSLAQLCELLDGFGRLKVNVACLPEGIERQELLTRIFEAVTLIETAVHEGDNTNGDETNESGSGRDITDNDTATGGVDEIALSSGTVRNTHLVKLNCEGLRQLTHAMSCLQIDWRELPPHLQTYLLEQFTAIAGSSTPEEVADITGSLTYMKCPLSETTVGEELAVDLVDKTLRTLRKLCKQQQQKQEQLQQEQQQEEDGDDYDTDSEIVHLLHGLSSIRADCSHLTPAGMSILEEAVSVVLGSEGADLTQIVSLIVSLGHINLQWPALSNELQNEILCVLPQTITTHQQSDVFNILITLGKLTVPWTELPDEFGAELSAYFSARTANVDGAFTPHTQEEVLPLVQAFAGTGARWADLPGPVKQGLSDDLSACVPLSGLSLTTLTKSLRALQCDVNKAENASLKQTILDTLAAPANSTVFESTSQAYHMVYNLSRLGVRWESLPAQFTQEALLVRAGQTVDMNSVVLALSSLPRMGAKWQQIDRLVLKGLQEGLQQHERNLTEKEISYLMRAMLNLCREVKYPKVATTSVAAGAAGSNGWVAANAFVGIHKVLLQAHKRVSTQLNPDGEHVGGLPDLTVTDEDREFLGAKHLESRKRQMAWQHYENNSSAYLKVLGQHKSPDKSLTLRQWLENDRN